MNKFVPGILRLISKLKSYKSNVTEENEQIKRLNGEILEVIQDEKFDNKMNSTFLFIIKYTIQYQGLRLVLLYHLLLIQQISMLVT